MKDRKRRKLSLRADQPRVQQQQLLAKHNLAMGAKNAGSLHCKTMQLSTAQHSAAKHSTAQRSTASIEPQHSNRRATPTQQYGGCDMLALRSPKAYVSTAFVTLLPALNISATQAFIKLYKLASTGECGQQVNIISRSIMTLLPA